MKNWDKGKLVLLSFVFFISACSKYKSVYSGKIIDKNGKLIKGVSIEAISNQEADSNFKNSLSQEEINLFKGEKNLSPCFIEKPDTVGKFLVIINIPHLVLSTPHLYLLFKKRGYKSFVLDMTQGSHINIEVKLDSNGGN